MGTAAMMPPSWPSTPVIWVKNGMRRGANHVFTSRRTHTKIIASPMPTKSRGDQGDRVRVGDGEQRLRCREGQQAREHDAT